MRRHTPADQRVTKRGHREHLKIHGWLAEPVDCPCDLQENRSRKTDAHDCGRVDCGICHGDKKFGHELTLQEISAELELEESILESIEERHV